MNVYDIPRVNEGRHFRVPSIRTVEQESPWLWVAYAVAIAAGMVLPLAIWGPAL
jgi:hypothetical protein